MAQVKQYLTIQRIWNERDNDTRKEVTYMKKLALILSIIILAALTANITLAAEQKTERSR